MGNCCVLAAPGGGLSARGKAVWGFRRIAKKNPRTAKRQAMMPISKAAICMMFLLATTSQYRWKKQDHRNLRIDYLG